MFFHDFDSVKTALAKVDVMTVDMGTLRDALGAGRLGVHIREQIERELDRRGIAFLPSALPNSQTDEVLLYRKYGAAASIIGQVLQDRNQQITTEPVNRDVGSKSPSTAARTLSAPLIQIIRALDLAESRPGHQFVGLKWFRDVAMMENGSASFPFASEDRNALIRDAIARGIVLPGKVPNPKKPEFPVTSVRLNRVLPEVRAVLSSLAGPAGFRPVAIRGEALSATVLRDRR